MVCVAPKNQSTQPASVAGTGRTLSPREVLFRTGERKTAVYRVDSGVICQYELGTNGDRTAIEFLFPGDFAGLGFLDTHTVSARALLKAEVTRLPVEAIEHLVAGDPLAESKLSAAVEREFEVRRDQLAFAGRSEPMERLASVLVNLSCSNAYEGRDPELITDRMDSQVWSEMLDLDIAELTGLLVEFERRNLVEAADGGLRLKNIAALEALADGEAHSLEQAPRVMRRTSAQQHLSHAA